MNPAETKKEPRKCPVCEETLVKGAMIWMYFGTNGKGFSVHLTRDKGEEVAFCVVSGVRKLSKAKRELIWNKIDMRDWEACSVGLSLAHAAFETKLNHRRQY